MIVIAPERRLQLEATSEIEAVYFNYELERVIKYWKSMSLNYKYNKKWTYKLWLNGFLYSTIHF